MVKDAPERNIFHGQETRKASQRQMFAQIAPNRAQIPPIRKLGKARAPAINPARLLRRRPPSHWVERSLPRSKMPE